MAQTSGPAPVAPGRGPAAERAALTISSQILKNAERFAGRRRLGSILILILIFEKFLKSF